MTKEIPLWVIMLILILCLCGCNKIEVSCGYRPEPRTKEDSECLYNSMIGELAGESEYEKITHLFFFDSQSKKHGKGYCHEFNSRAGGGALRWTSNTKYHLDKVKQTISIKKEKEFRQIIMNFYSGKYCPDDIQKKVMTMNHCLIRSLFNNKNPSKWWNKKRLDYVLTNKVAYTYHKW